VTEKKQILRSIGQTVTCDISDNSEYAQEQESKQIWSDFQSNFREIFPSLLSLLLVLLVYI
jgi:mannose/fructose/N-acetylgalactosamine-specific phosphotransferase system component IID